MDTSSVEPGHIGIVGTFLPFVVLGTFAAITAGVVYVCYLIARALWPADTQRPRS